MAVSRSRLFTQRRGSRLDLEVRDVINESVLVLAMDGLNTGAVQDRLGRRNCTLADVEACYVGLNRRGVPAAFNRRCVTRPGRCRARAMPRELLPVFVPATRR